MKTSITQLLLFIYLLISSIQNLPIAPKLAKFNLKIKIFNFDIRLLLVFLLSTLCWKSNAQTSGSYEFFESFRPTSARATMIATDGWSFNTAAVTPATALANARTGNNILSFGNVAGNNAITPSLNNPNVFKFYYRSSSATNNVTFKVDWSANNFASSPLGSVTGIVTSGTTFQLLSLNTSNFGTNVSLKFRITITATVSGAALFIDDMSCTSTVGSENNLIVPDMGSLTSYQTVPVPGGNAPLTPSKYTFYDQGGLYDNYNKSQVQTNFFTPTNSWDKVKITFNSFTAESSTNISVYNWDGVIATPLLATFVGTNANHLPSPASYTTLNPGNSLKVVYTSGATQANATIPGYDCTVESISYLSISNLSASSGCVGTPLTINGTSLNNATAVTINGVAATINSNSPTQIVVMPAAGSVGTGAVSVTTPLGIVSYSSYTVNALPTITVSSTTATLCSSINSQTVPLTYSGTTGTPSTYSIAWGALPTNSFVAVVDGSLPSSSIVVNVPAETATGTYTGNLTVKNSLGCQSPSQILSIVVNPPTIIPNFNAIAPIIPGASINNLPTTSLEGITGSWSPDINNLATTTYTFTPNSGQCSTNAAMTIVVDYSLLTPVNPLTPGGKLEPIFDRFGNKYGLDKIKIAPIASVGNKNLMLTSSLLCSSGIFDLYFEAGSGMEGNTTAEIDRRNVVCQVFSDLSNFINSPLHNAGNTTRVKIWVRDITQIPNVNPATLGLATGFYNVPSSPNAITGGIVDNEVWKTIHSGVDSYTNVANPIISNSGVSFSAGLFYHGMMAINPNVSWNTDLSVNASTSQNDLYSVILHEVAHALGFASLINFDGNSKLGLSYKYYSRYDTFLNYAATKLISPSSSGCSMYDYNFNVDPVNLHPGCGLTPPVNTGTPLDHTDCTTAVNFVGTDTVPVYTSSCFETASSLSHFEDECFINPTTSIAYGNNNYFVMSNANSPGATKRYLKPEERATLCDLGYNLNTQYGNSSQNSFYNYGGANCLGISVAGINDGITGTAFSFIGSVSQPITITGILNNDVSYNSDYSTNNQNNLRFECLQDVYDTTASITATGYDINATVTFISAVSGVHLLRYIPYDTVSGQRGNITYIYVFVKNVNSCGIPDNCNLVINGDFEQHSQVPNTLGQIEFSCNWTNGNDGTVDYYRTDGTTLYCQIPNNGFGSQNVNNSSGNAYAGIYSIRDFDSGNPYNEIIATKLKTPLQPNTSYQLTFDVSLGDYVSSNPIRFQAYIGTDAPNPMLSYYSNFPVSSTGIFLENNNLSTDTQNWETITFTFTTDNSANQQYLYIGGLKDVIYANQNPPIPNFYLTASYYYLDNVSLVPIGDAKLNLPDTVCYASALPDLSSYLQSAPPTGVFSGDGVIASGTAPHIVYSFDPSSLSAGSHTISYTYAPSLGCPLVTITKSINVALCPQFNPIAPICQGATAPALPANPVNIPTLTGTWSPATIDTSIAGTFTYTFTPTTGQSTTATGTITVTILPLPSAGTISGATTIYGTSTTTLTPTAAGGTWTTNDASIATVDATGIVTGVIAGTTNIIYTIIGSNGCTASISTSITVVPINTSCNDVTLWNGTTWSNGVPNTSSYLSTAVVFTANFDTTEDLYACTVLVTNGATVNVNHIGDPLMTTTANTFTVTNEVVVNTGSLFFFDDDSSLVQINDVANTGNIKYKRTTPDVNKFDYTYWSSPVDGQTLVNLSPDTLSDKFYRWNPLINNWVNTPNTNLMNTGQGYIIRGPQSNIFGVSSFDGYFIGIPHNGVYTTPVYNAASSWNLLGNPYPSGLNIDCFLSDSTNVSLGGTVYFWSHDIPIDWTGTTQQGFPGSAVYNYNVFSYTGYNRLGGVATAITPLSNGTFATNRPIGTVATGQGFFIEAAISGVAKFSNSMRVGSQSQQNSQFFKNSTLPALPTTCTTDERHRIWLYIRNLTPAQQFKETLVGYSANATTSTTLDRDYDAKTFIADPNAINLYSLSPGNDQLAIQGRYLPTTFDTTDVVPLGYSCKLNPAATSNTLEIGSTDFDGLFTTTNFYLRILQSDTTYAYHNLKASPYQFSITADVFNNTTQFALVFDVPAGATILKNAITESNFKVTMSPNPFDKSFSLQLQSSIKNDVSVTIFDILGKKLSSETMSVENLKNAIFGTSLASGVYQVVISQGENKEVIKVIKN